MEIQEEISNEIQSKKVGNVYKVIIDSVDEMYYSGRTEWDSPEVDPEVLIPVENSKLEIGNFYQVEITDATPFELFGKVVEWQYVIQKRSLGLCEKLLWQ